MNRLPLIFHDIYEALHAFFDIHVTNLSDNTDISKITENIYIGNFSTGTNRTLLKKNGITHIISALSYFSPPHPNDFSYLNVFVHDWIHESIYQEFNKTNTFINTAINKGGKVYVHCISGMSRSVTLVMAYLLAKNASQKCKKNVSDILSYVQARRRVANPNSGFIKQLNQFQEYMSKIHQLD